MCCLDVLDDNERRVRDVLECFEQVRNTDPRLMIVLAFARTDAAVTELVRRYCNTANGYIPQRFCRRIAILRRHGLIDADYVAFLNTLAAVRNSICHEKTNVETLRSSQFSRLVRLYQIAARCNCNAVSPLVDLQRSIWTLCIASCVAIELDIGPEPRSLAQASTPLVA